MGSIIRVLGVRSAYSLAVFPISIASFVVVLTTLVLGAAMSITIVGLPILALSIIVARGLAHGERGMLRAMMSVPAPTPAYQRGGPAEWWRRIIAPLRDPQSWLDVVFALIRLPLAIASFVITVLWWALAGGGLTWPLWGWSIPRGPDNSSLAELIGLGDSYWTDTALHVAIGAVFALTLRWAIPAAAWIHAGPASLLLCGRAQMQVQLDAARASRDATRSAEAGALRRLERDIHDGPQQQLVRLSMDLGRVRRQIDENPQRAREILDEAIERSGETLDELRSLSRGIAPPLLADRGLQAALHEIVARAPIPVHLEYDVTSAGLPDHVETTTYFVVSEALANTAKHADASCGSVQVVQELSGLDRALSVVVIDDGHGGAHVAKGTGLSGLAERVRSVDGTFDVHSPEGGPTVIEARIPCG